jgi:hypothetical protein
LTAASYAACATRKSFETAIKPDYVILGLVPLLHFELIRPLGRRELRLCEISNEAVQLGLRHGKPPRKIGAQLAQFGYQANRVRLVQGTLGHENK